jgi:hypothetical protein
MSTIIHTHYVGHLTGKFYCLGCGAKPENAADPLCGKGCDYDDYDCNGALIECEDCGEYVFPAEAAEREAEDEAIMRSVRREYRLTPRVTRDDLDAYEPGSAKRIMLERYL